MNDGFLAMRDGFFRLHEVIKAMRHGFFGLRKIKKAIADGFSMVGELFYNVRDMADANEKTDLPPTDPKHPTDWPTTTRTHYDLLAEEIMEDIDRIAAKIPKLEAHHRVTENEIRAHMNVPRPFLGTAVAAVEQSPELRGTRKLVPEQGQDTLQYLDAFRIVDDKLGVLRTYLRFTLMSRHTALALRALQIYAIARGFARDPRGAKVAPHVEHLRRDLGKRGRPRKK